MKIKRLLGIVFYLLSKNIVSSRELAEHFDVSVRTILRDMDYLSESGIPIVSEMGKDGGFGIMNSYKLDARLVDNEDLFYIMSSLESLSSTYHDERLESTIIKLRGLLSANSDIVLDKKEKLRFDFSSLKIKDEDNTKMQMLNEAINSTKMIRFNYISFKGEKTERTVEPHMIMFKWYSWYLYSYCNLRSKFRVFRISRMKDIEMLDSHFKRKELDIEELDKTYQTRSDKVSTKTVLRFDNEMRYIIDNYFKEWEKEYKNDGIYIHYTVPIDNWFFGMILSYGSAVEIIEPTELREELQKRIKQIEKLYTASNI
jgi:predicted DNA-binding transcriptional regulator YafY